MFAFRRILVLLVLQAVTFVLPVVHADAYIEVSLDREIVGAVVEELSGEERVEMVRNLTALARNFDEVPMTARAKALGLALHLDDRAKAPVVANGMLRRGTNPPPLADVGEKAAVISALVARGTALAESENDPTLQFAHALFDVVIAASPANDEAIFQSKILHTMLEEGPAWEGLEDVSNKSPVPDDQEPAIVPPPAIPGEPVPPTSNTQGTGSEMPTEEGLPSDAPPKGGELLATTRVLTNSVNEETQMVGTECFVHSSTNLGFEFEESVGESLRNRLEVIRDFMESLHGEKAFEAQGFVVSFEEQRAKSGQAATVCCALLVDASIRGVMLAEDIAIAGDMNPTGEIQPISGVAARLQAAARSGTEIVSVPWDNRMDVSDLVLVSGVSLITKLQVFGARDYSEVWDIAQADRNKALKGAIDAYASLIQRAGVQAGNPAAFRGEEAQAILAEVVELAPNHLSARLLFSASNGRLPTTLSPRGTFDQLEILANRFFSGTKSRGGRNFSKEVNGALTELQKVSLIADPRAKNYVNSLLSLGQLQRRLLGRADMDRSQLATLLDDVAATAEKCRSLRKRLASDLELDEETVE